jgi:hypothetical protein
MTTNQETREETLTQLLSVPDDRGFSVVGNPDAGWMMISNLVLGEAFNKSTTPVNNTFAEDGSGPKVLLPAMVKLNPDCQACPRFLGEIGPKDLWRPLCPYVFEDVGNKVLDFVVRLAGLLANPCLCGLLGCPVRDQAKLAQPAPRVRVRSRGRVHDA